MNTTKCSHAACDVQGRWYQDPDKVGTQYTHFYPRRCEEHAPRTADGRAQLVNP